MKTEVEDDYLYVLKVREPELGSKTRTFRFETEAARDEKAAEAEEAGLIADKALMYRGGVA
jgi:hypothetical protein